MQSGTVNSSSPEQTQDLHPNVAEILSPVTSRRETSHVTFPSQARVSEASVMIRKPFVASHFETYSSALSTHAKSPLIAEGPSGLVILGSTLFSLALLVFVKCKSPGRRPTAQL